MKTIAPDQSGTLTVDAPPPGTWIVQLSGSSQFPDLSTITTIDEGSVPVTLEFDLPAPGNVTVTGTLVNGADDPIAHGFVQVGKVESPVKDDGTFRLEGLQVGSRVVKWTDAKRTYHVGLGVFEVPDRDHLEHDFRMPGTATVRVRWIGLPEELQPFHMMVTLEPVAVGASSITGGGKADSVTEVGYVPLGRYRVSPTLWANSMLNLPATETDIVSDDAPHEVELQYTPPCRVTLNLETSGGADFPDQLAITLQANGQGHKRLVTVDQGSATLEHYGEGTYELIVEGMSGQFDPSQQTIELIPGKGSIATVVLAEKN